MIKSGWSKMLSEFGKQMQESLKEFPDIIDQQEEVKTVAPEKEEAETSEVEDPLGLHGDGMGAGFSMFDALTSPAEIGGSDFDEATENVKATSGGSTESELKENAENAFKQSLKNNERPKLF